MSLIAVNFKTRQIVERVNAPALEEHPADTGRELTDADLFADFDHKIECIQNRFGDTPPHGGVVYNGAVTAKGFDTYGRGNVHNSIHQWRPKTPAEKDAWNRPMPFPADLRKIDKGLRKLTGKTVRVGLKSDAFMWMDRKYNVTLSTIKLATKHGVKLEFHTMSDLCAHDDYISELKAGGHSVVMQVGFQHMLSDVESNSLERKISPGAPSIPRRLEAIEKLTKAGVSVRKVYSDLGEIIKDKELFNYLCRTTGTGPDYWVGGAK